VFSEIGSPATEKWLGDTVTFGWRTDTDVQLSKAVQWLEKADFEAKIVVAGMDSVTPRVLQPGSHKIQETTTYH
jgi:hypothetical protein